MFRFKEMYKLVKGELFKFVKSATCLVLVIFVMLFIIVTSLVYDPDSEGLGNMADFLGGSVYADDYFSDLKNASYSEYIDRYEIETPLPDGEIEAEFSLELKQKFITTKRQDYYASLNPVLNVVKDVRHLWDPKIFNFMAEDFNFYNLFIASGEIFSERSADVETLFKNNGADTIINILKGGGGGTRAMLFESESRLKLLVGDDIFGLINSDAEKRRLVEVLHAAYKIEGGGAVAALVHYVSYFQSVHGHINYMAKSVFGGIAGNLDRAKRFFYYVKDSGYTKSVPDFINALILDYGDAYYELNDAIGKAEDDYVANGKKYTEESIEELIEAYKKFNSRYYTARGMITVGYNTGVNFLFFPTTPEEGNIISSFIAPAPEAYQAFQARHTRISEEFKNADGILDETNVSPKIVFDTIKGFYETLELEALVFTKESVDISVRMEDSLAVANDSLRIVFSKEIYDEDFAFIDARLDELLVIMSRLSRLDNVSKYYKSFYQEPLITALSEGYAEDFFAPEEFFNNAQKLVIESGYINEYFKKQNFSLIVEQEKYTDDDVSNIYGLFNFLVIGTSKYSLRSDVAKIVFMLDNRESLGTLTTPLALDGGYGFLFFSFSILYLFLIIAGIVIGAGTIAGEHTAGTIKLLLIRPYKRWKFLMSKIVMAIIVLAALFIVSFLLLWLIGGIFWGFESEYKVLVMFNATKVIIMSQFQTAALMALFFFIECVIYMLISVMVSTIFKSKSGAVAISMAIYFAANILILTLSSKSWFKYVLFNNTNLFFYMSTGPTLNDMTFGFSVIVDLIYIFIIMTATFWVFTKKDAN
jgi:ABC-type transport system involved in multi-copper enzyme maturation permease subunit